MEEEYRLYDVMSYRTVSKGPMCASQSFSEYDRLIVPATNEEEARTLARKKLDESRRQEYRIIHIIEFKIEGFKINLTPLEQKVSS